MEFKQAKKGALESFNLIFFTKSDATRPNSRCIDINIIMSMQYRIKPIRTTEKCCSLSDVLHFIWIKLCITSKFSSFAPNSFMVVITDQPVQWIVLRCILVSLPTKECGLMMLGFTKECPTLEMSAHTSVNQVSWLFNDSPFTRIAYPQNFSRILIFILTKLQFHWKSIRNNNVVLQIFRWCRVSFIILKPQE